jgi:hypothetical protein
MRFATLSSLQDACDEWAWIRVGVDPARGRRTRMHRNNGGFTVIRKKQASTRNSKRLRLLGKGARSSGISQSWQPQMKSEKLIIICTAAWAVRNWIGTVRQAAKQTQSADLISLC